MVLPPASAVTAQPLLVAAVLLAVAAPALVLQRAEGDRHRRVRLLSSATGALLLVLVWFTPLQTVAQHYLLSAHLLQITVLMGAVPPLLLLGLPRDAVGRPPRWVRAALGVLVHPVFAILAVNAAFFGWHIAGPYDASMQDDTLYALQQLSLLAASLLFWWPIVSPLATTRSMSYLAKMGYILLATIPQTFGGLAVALAHHVLYLPYATAPRVTSLDALTDQQVAGACIALLSKIALFTAFTVLFLRMLSAQDSEGDEGGGGDGGSWRRDTPRPAPSGTPRWLDDLERGRTVPEPAIPRPVRLPAGSGSRPEPAIPRPVRLPAGSGSRPG